MTVQVDQARQDHAVGFETPNPGPRCGGPDPHDRAAVDLHPAVLDHLVRREDAAAEGERPGGSDASEQRAAARPKGKSRRLRVLLEDGSRVLALETDHQPFPLRFVVDRDGAVAFRGR